MKAGSLKLDDTFQLNHRHADNSLKKDDVINMAWRDLDVSQRVGFVSALVFAYCIHEALGTTALISMRHLISLITREDGTIDFSENTGDDDLIGKVIAGICFVGDYIQGFTVTKEGQQRGEEGGSNFVTVGTFCIMCLDSKGAFRSKQKHVDHVNNKVSCYIFCLNSQYLRHNDV